MTRKLLPVIALLLAAAMAAPAQATPGHLEGYVPVVANITGQNTSFWTTDLWIYQQGASVIHLWFNPAGNDNTSGESVVIPLNAPVVHFTDVVKTLFNGNEIAGSLHYLADGPVVVVSRTWTAAPDGNGTYGQTIPGIPIGRASVAGTGQAGALRMIIDQGPDVRVNVGLVNVSPVPVTTQVEIFTADGNPAPGASSIPPIDLKPFDMTQINQILTKYVDPGTRKGLIVRVGITSGEGAIMAYATSVDWTTNDSSYQEGFRFGF